MWSRHVGENIILIANRMDGELVFNVDFKQAVGEAALFIQAVNIKIAAHFV